MAKKWKVVEAWDGYTIEDENGNQVIEQSGPYGTPCIAKADADLMAASPDLLEALESFLMTWESESPCISDYAIAAKSARAAIAKAKGDA